MVYIKDTKIVSNKLALNDIVSFVRRSGRKLTTYKKDLLNDFLPQIELNKNSLKNLIDCHNQGKKIILEIGFGAGEHLFYQAQNNPNDIFIGCEVFTNGIASLLSKIDQFNQLNIEKQVNNIFIYQGDAIKSVQEFPDNFLSKIFILFPDPWPKKKHFKRRIISQSNLDLFFNKLNKKDSNFEQLLRIVTDHSDYASWIIKNLILRNDFYWLADSPKDWLSPPKDWIKTRYQIKALENDPKCNINFFDFTVN